MNTITLKEVTKKYKVKGREVTALEGVSAEISETDFLVFTGQSGSGKSTILQLIAGLERPTSGEIVVNGANITKMKAKELAEFRKANIGIVFQQFYLEPTLTLRRNIELPAMFTNITTKERDERTLAIAKLMGLEEHLEHRPAELSGGQIQRAAIARAIYNQPKILIADEPTSNLDPKNTENVLELFRKVREEMGMMVILATHDMRIAGMAERCIKLEYGRVVPETSETAEEPAVLETEGEAENEI